MSCICLLCPGRDSNPHGPFGPEDFKSSASTLSPPGQLKWFTTFGPTTTAASCQCNEVGWGSPFYISREQVINHKIIQYPQPGLLCHLGGIRTLHPSPDFHSQAFYQLNYKTSFCLDVIASHPHSTTPGLCATAIVDFENPGNQSLYHKSLQNLSSTWVFFTPCDPDGARTRDPNIKSVVLYRLSYGVFPYISILH